MGWHPQDMGDALCDWITGKHGWNMRFWIESGSIPGEKMEKFEGKE